MDQRAGPAAAAGGLAASISVADVREIPANVNGARWGCVPPGASRTRSRVDLDLDVDLERNVDLGSFTVRGRPLRTSNDEIEIALEPALAKHERRNCPSAAHAADTEPTPRRLGASA